MDKGSIYVRYGDQPLHMAKRILEDAGVEQLFTPGMHVGLKPNLVVAAPAADGATTHPEIVEGVVQFLQGLGITDITIMEGSWLGADTERAYKVCGYDDLARRYNLKIMDLKRDQTVSFPMQRGTLKVCKSALDVDALINLPVLKAHCQTALTCALKNLKGCIPDSEKRRFHAEGLHRPIAELASVLHPTFTLVDGICGDLTFEEGGNPVTMNRVLLAQDPVKLDAYAASLLGLALDDVPYIRLAEQMGAGSARFEDSDIITFGETQASIIEAAQRGSSLIWQLTRNVKADQACSACYGNLVQALYRLSEEGVTIKRPIHIGQGYRASTSLDGIGIGNCCKGATTHVPGCPCRAIDIMDTLRALS